MASLEFSESSYILIIRALTCYHSFLLVCINLRKCFDLKGGYRGFYARNTITLTPSSVNNIHKCGGTILGTSRGGHDTNKKVDSIQDH